MTHNAMTYRSTAALMLVSCLSTLPTAALAQVAPPPGEKQVTEPFTPPERVRPTAVAPDPAEVERRRAAEEAARNARPARVELPDIEHGTLVRRDANGKVRRLETSSSVAALELNPMVDAETRVLVDEYLFERRRDAMERAVQYHDIAWRVYTGELIDGMTIADREALEETLGLLQPVSLPGAEQVLEKELSVFDPVAAEFNRKIANEYLAALQAEVIEAGPGEGETMPDLVAREMFRDATKDVMAAYHRLMWTTGHLIGGREQTLGSVSGITAEQQNEIQRRRTRLLMADTERNVALATGRIMEVLTEEQRLQLLGATREWWKTRGEDL